MFFVESCSDPWQKHGYIYYIDQTAIGNSTVQRYPENTYVRLTCYKGWSVLTSGVYGFHIATCLNGTWSNTLAACVLEACNLFFNI